MFRKIFKAFSTISDPVSPPVIAFSCQLKSRGLISVSGNDAINVLQGISTNNMKIFSQNDKRIALHTCFLSTTGRIIADAILVRPSILEKDGPHIKDDEIWLDVESSQKEKIIKHLKTYSLRKKITINDLSDEMKIFAINSPFMCPHPDREGFDQEEIRNDAEVDKELDDDYDTYKDTIFVDPRCSRLGMRIIIHKDDEFEFDNSQQLTSIDELGYKKFRILYGICQGEEVQDIIPFQANFDLINSISFDKGCYLGQELMARSYHTGIIRKRMLPFVVSKENIDCSIDITKDLKIIKNSFKEDLKDKIIFNEKNEKIGKILFNTNNIGIGLFNYLGWENTKPVSFKTENLNCGIIWNEWILFKLQNYMEFIKEKKLI